MAEDGLTKVLLNERARIAPCKLAVLVDLLDVVVTEDGHVVALEPIEGVAMVCSSHA